MAYGDYGYSALRRTPRPSPGAPEEELYAEPVSPLELADNSTTQDAFARQAEMRRAAEDAARIEQQRAAPAPIPQPAATPSRTAPLREPYVSPFGTQPMTDEQYRALPKAGPRSALDYPIIAQAPPPGLLGTGAAAQAGGSLRRGSVRSRVDAAEDAALGVESPELPSPETPSPGQPPKPSFFDRLFKPKPKAQPLQIGSYTTGIRG